jgi:hypothetical protein
MNLPGTLTYSPPSAFALTNGGAVQPGGGMAGVMDRLGGVDGRVRELKGRLATVMRLHDVEWAVVHKDHHPPGVQVFASKLFSDAGRVSGKGFVSASSWRTAPSLNVCCLA